MSLGRSSTIKSDTRDPEADFIDAYRAEYESYKVAGHHERAADVVKALKDLGHEIGDLEYAVSPEALETAVEAPKRRGRPPKTD